MAIRVRVATGRKLLRILAIKQKKPAATDIPESATGKEKITLALPPHTALLLEMQPE